MARTADLGSTTYHADCQLMGVSAFVASQLAVAFACLATCVGGWRTWGVLPLDSTFASYVGKFCFDYTRQQGVAAGHFSFSIEGKVQEGAHTTRTTEGAPCWGPCETQGNIYLMVFDDEQDHWARIREKWHSITCEEMLHDASFAVNIRPLNGQFNRTVEVTESVRPRFWYFIFAACGVDVVEPIIFEIHAENFRHGIETEFSLDENGSLAMHLLFAFLFTAVAIALRHVARRATGAEALRSRPLLRLLLVSCLCSAAGSACISLHYAVYAANGYGLRVLEVLGQLWLCGAKVLLTVLQLLTAKGWALFYAPEEMLSRRLMFLILGGIILTSVWCEIHAQYFHDWSTTLYLYESIPGMIILGLNVLLFLEAWRSMHETYRLETSTEVRLFYALTSASSFLYFLSLPVMCVLAMELDPWVRAKYVARAEAVSRYIACLLLAYCLRPSRLDAMINARLEQGLETVGEMRDELDDDCPDSYQERMLDSSEGEHLVSTEGYRQASEDMPTKFQDEAGVHPAE